MLMRRLAYAVVLCALVCSSCASLHRPYAAPLPPETMGGAHVGVRVEGVVTDRWGYVVPDAWITVRVGSPQIEVQGDPECAGAVHLPTRTRTSPIGEFAVVVDGGRRRPFLACLEVEALPPARLDLRENRVIVPSAPFTTAGATGAGEPVRVRVVLY